jgi:hypothetical protein
MDGRVDRARCEDEEERCDVCRESDAMMDELEAQRQAYVQREHEKQERLMDSAIDIPSSDMPFSGFPSEGFESSHGPFPSSPPPRVQSSVISFNQGFIADRISPEERFDSSPSRVSGSSSGYGSRHRIGKKAIMCGIWRIG